MPVTAKLSRKFYDTFGDEIANELVDWFNQVDATYRFELRELNEVNFARFDAKVEQRFAESDARLERRFAEFETHWEQRFSALQSSWGQQFSALDAKWERRFSELEAMVDRRFAEVDVKLEQRFAEVDVKLASLKAELIKWMFLFWLGTIGTVLALQAPDPPAQRRNRSASCSSRSLPCSRAWARIRTTWGRSLGSPHS